MNVLLFDDDKVSLQKLEQKIVKYNCTIFAYQSVDEFINSNVIFDIAFLDIELDNNTSGFQFVKALSNNNKKCIISFFTNYNK